MMYDQLTSEWRERVNSFGASLVAAVYDERNNNIIYEIELGNC